MSFVNKGELGQEEGSTQRPFGLGRYIGELVNFWGWGWVSICSHLGQSLGLERRWDVRAQSTTGSCCTHEQGLAPHPG